jgi:hypothetical protein
MCVFSHIHSVFGGSCLAESDACSLFSILNDLGYRDISFLHKGTCFLTMNAVFRFTRVVLKIGWASNPHFESDPCLREAEFYLDIQGEYGKIYLPRYCPYDEFSSSADVLSISIGSSTYFVSTIQMADCCLCEKLNEIAGMAQSVPELTVIREVIGLLYQVLKLYRMVHHRGYALMRDPKRLMLLYFHDGHGCQAVSRLEFKGKSYALVLGSAAYCQKQGFVYHSAEQVAMSSGNVNGRCTMNSSFTSPPSNSSACILAGVKIAAFFSERKELVRFGNNSAETNKDQEISGFRRDLQLIAETFIEILSGHISQGDSKLDCGQSLVQDDHAGLDNAAHALFAAICLRNGKQEAESNAMVYSRMPQEYKELLKLVCRLRYFKEITVTDALESEIFDSHKKEDAWRHDPWRHQDIPHWSMLPFIVAQNFWRRTIAPKCQHYYVKGGPYDIGEKKKPLQLKAVWLVYECVGDITGHDSWQRTVRLAESGSKNDIVAVYVCPLIFRSSSDFEFLDVRWTLNIKSSDDWLYNGRTCGMFNPHIAVERQQVAAYINSSKDMQSTNRKSSLQHDFCRKRYGLPKGQNCTVYYPHGWGRMISKDSFLAKPWLGTIAFKLTSDQPPYTELAHPYDWRKWDSEYHLKYMQQTSTDSELYRPIRLSSRSRKAC